MYISATIVVAVSCGVMGFLLRFCGVMYAHVSD